MNWRAELQTKIRSAHSEIAELRRYLAEQGIAESESEHLFAGHYEALDDIYLKHMPLAVALDISDMVVRYNGPLAKRRFCPISKMNKIFTNLRDQVVGMAKTHRSLSASSFRWQGDVDLMVTVARPDLTFGLKMPEPGVTEEGHQLPNFQDPHYIALKDSLRLMGVITASLQDEHPRERIDAFAREHSSVVDEAFIDAGLVAARKLIPSREKYLDSVEVAGKALHLPDPVTLDYAEWQRATRVLNENRIPRDRTSVTGDLMAVDYEVNRFEIRHLDGWRVRSVRCVYKPEHEEFVKSHGKKRVIATGATHFDREGNPRFLHVEELETARPSRE